MVQVDLDLLLPLPSGPGRRQALQDALRHAIQSGALVRGARLPSSRVLAADLAIARGTVVQAYEQLVAEGWLRTRPASGTVVAGVGDTRPGLGNLADDAPMVKTTDYLRCHDLRPGRPEAGSFPRTAWMTAMRVALAEAADDVWDDRDVFGQLALRSALASYLGRVRGVVAAPERIVACAGFSGGLGLVGSLLPPGTSVAVEATTLPGLRAILEGLGHPTIDLPVDDRGAVTEALDDLRPPPAAVLLTPAHQNPLGASLDPHRRHHLLRWAERTGAIIIEDDYDGEFRYDRQPVGALQALAPDHVVYGGTTSKTLAPALRLGWLALPPRLAHELASADPGPPRHCPVPVPEQLAMAQLVESGAYDRHVRRMRRRYRQRRDELVRGLARVAPDLAVQGIDAGLHAVVPLPDAGQRRAVVAACVRRGIDIAELPADGGCPGLVVGYGAPAGHAFQAALAALLAAFEEALGSGGRSLAVRS